jgi:hypothetical protein
MDLLDDRFRLAAVDTIRNRTFPNVGQHVSVRFSSLGDDGVLLGAAALVLRNELGIVFTATTARCAAATDPAMVGNKQGETNENKNTCRWPGGIDHGGVGCVR